MSELESILITSPESLPSFFRDVQVIGPAHLELQKYRAKYSKLDISSKPTNCEVRADKSPMLLVPKEVREAYQRNDFAAIKKFETQSQEDLQAVYDNVSKNGEKAWTKVKKDGKEFYMSWSDKGSMWAYTVSTSTSDDVTQQALVQIGTYSKSTSVLGLQSYNLTLPTVVAESLIALIVARAVSGIIAEGLGFAIASFSLLLAQAAAAAGFESFSFAIPVALVSTVASCLVFAVVFIGLAYLWNWLNRKYTIRLQVFNWDYTNDWSVNGQYLSNATICGGNGDNKVLNFTLPKMVKPGDVVTPPGFDPVEALDSVCYYGVIIWENDNTFAQGCSMAIPIEKNKNEGFMWAFDCPRFSSNQQAAENGIKDPKIYRDTCHWNEQPLGFKITSSKIPVSFALDALSGASDGLYNINIHIGELLEQTIDFSIQDPKPTAQLSMTSHQGAGYREDFHTWSLLENDGFMKLNLNIPVPIPVTLTMGLCAALVDGKADCPFSIKVNGNFIVKGSRDNKCDFHPVEFTINESLLKAGDNEIIISLERDASTQLFINAATVSEK
ncbi:hypothetical protein FXV91_09930 [Methanosarcina sp. DH2]|uniref:hypothetical protein n=1 Tax=Methanosarcina sp. DH2 TaxID=2605639 RepID=UPI001E35866A|nr:hypothetical protein [Methanosarcina sp. DH2]MCC4770493.1 hypothetical protein [Methanosarcina sp. DH2]